MRLDQEKKLKRNWHPFYYLTLIHQNQSHANGLSKAKTFLKQSKLIIIIKTHHIKRHDSVTNGYARTVLPVLQKSKHKDKNAMLCSCISKDQVK